jgi:6-pyruvoyl-tetrahydropterin synthase
MEHSSWVQISFEAGHHLIPCGAHVTEHGHRYLIRSFLSGKYDPIRPPRLSELREDMAAVRAELDGTIIDDMLQGASTTPGGIAAWLLERLVLCAAVEVRQDEFSSVTVQRKEQ